MPADRRTKDAWRTNDHAAPRPRDGTPKPARMRWFAAAFVLLGIIGLIVGLFVFRGKQPDPVLLAIPITQYTHPDWPANPMAEHDVRAFRDRFGGDSAQALQLQEKARILRELNHLADDSRGANQGRPIVIHLCALGAVTDNGVSLIPGDGIPDEPSTWITLNELLQPLRRMEASRLLILDLRPVRSARTILPAVDVNAALDAELAKLSAANDLPFLVLNANTPHDGPLVLQPWKHTAFGLALAHAAGGSADGWNSSNTIDHRVDVRELAEAVRETTNFITNQAGTTPQVPRLHGSGSDFHLLPVPTVAALPELPESVEPQPAWLLDAWKTRDVYQKDGLALRAPRLMNAYTHALARADQQLLAGADASSTLAMFQSVAGDVQALQSRFRKLVAPKFSIARAIQDTTVSSKIPTVEVALRPVLERIRNPEGLKPDELAAAMQPIWAKPPDAEPYDAIAAVAFEAAFRYERVEQFQQLAAFLKGFKPAIRQPEIAVIELIAKLPPDMVKRWPMGSIKALLELTRQAEAATAMAAPYAEWFIGNLDAEGVSTGESDGSLSRTDTARREVLQAFTDDATSNANLKKASDRIERIVRDYRAIRDATITLDAARLEYEETRAELNDLAVRFPHELVAVPILASKNWSGLVENMLRLQTNLRPLRSPGLQNLDELTQQTAALRASRIALRNMVKVPASGSVTLDAQALQWPRWSASERAELRNRYQQKLLAICSQIKNGWPTKPSGQEIPVPSSMENAVRTRSLMECQRMLDILRIAELPKVDDLEREVSKLGKEPTPSDLLAVGKKLRNAWTVQLAKDFTTVKREDAARFGFIVHPHDATALPRAGLRFEPNPEATVSRERMIAFHRWLGRSRYLADAVAMQREGQQFIPQAARDASDAMKQLGREYLDWKP